MAAKTPSTVNGYSLGDLRLIIAVFTDIDDGDTWTSALGNVVDCWVRDNDNPTTQASVGCAVTNSTGTFTFYPAEDNKPVNLFVLTRG